MKKYFKLLLIILIICPCLCLFSACSNGKSAYELAVENGFNGTVQEWLESLKGADGTNGTNGRDAASESSYQMWQNAKLNGEFSGTYVEFLQTYFINNDDICVFANKALSSMVEISTGSGGGSGVIFSIDASNNAYIITNYHVIYGASSITAKLFDCDDSQKFTLSFVGASATYDIAVMRAENCSILETSHAKAVQFCLDNVTEGQNCFAIGNTNLEGLSLTKGCISQVDDVRSISVANVTTNHRLIRHSAFISNGNSGGGLFNSSGELIGITNSGLKANSSTTNALVNFAIPANIVYSITNNIINNNIDSSSTVAKTTNLGLTFNVTTTREENTINHTVSTVDTLTISSIESTSPFYSTLVSGDKLVSIKITTASKTITKTITRDFDYYDLVLLLSPNDSIELTFKRTGEANNIVVQADSDDLIFTQVL